MDTDDLIQKLLRIDQNLWSVIKVHNSNDAMRDIDADVRITTIRSLGADRRWISNCIQIIKQAIQYTIENPS